MIIFLDFKKFYYKILFILKTNFTISYLILFIFEYIKNMNHYL
jgi:hypothetical protein